MRLLFLTLALSMFLFSCDKDRDEIKTEPQQTKQVKLEDEERAVNTSNKAQGEYKLGVDYFEIETPYPTDNESQVVVYEFFGYTCPHCFHFEPFINKWSINKPDYVTLKRVPLNFQPAWEIYQQSFLTAETMGIIDKTHNQLFKAIHEDHKKFRTIDDLATWYEKETGTEKQAFLSTAESFILDSAQRKADNMGFKMQVTGTPSLVVNGKYKVSNKIRDKNRSIKVLTFLVEKEATSMGLISK